jgi:hypothetical protein
MLTSTAYWALLYLIDIQQPVQYSGEENSGVAPVYIGLDPGVASFGLINRF